MASQYVKGFVGRKEAETADYILFRVTKGKVEAITYGPGEWRIDMATTLPYMTVGEGRVLPRIDDEGKPKAPSTDWDYAIMINFRKIREEVDASF